MALILSLFPGLGLLDRAFETEGFCVVRGPDLLWGSDIRGWHPPRAVFDGVIGGDPCQAHSTLGNLVRAKGLEPRFGDLTPELVRVIEEARPLWFLRENVLRAPEPKPAGYEVTSFILDNTWLGEAQRRRRRFWFGWWGSRGPAPNLRQWIPGVALELVSDSHRQAVCADSRAVPVRLGGSGKVKCSPVMAGHGGNRAHDGKRSQPLRCSLGDMLELQGLPRDFLDASPFTMQAKRELIGNGVPLPMGRAVARAVRLALAQNGRGERRAVSRPMSAQTAPTPSSRSETAETTSSGPTGDPRT
jgi:DNA (cytosine-5)-methyltransferase 1